MKFGTCPCSNADTASEPSAEYNVGATCSCGRTYYRRETLSDGLSIPKIVESGDECNDDEDGVANVCKRPAINQATFQEVYEFNRPEKRGFAKSIAQTCQSKCAECPPPSRHWLWCQIKYRFPILTWLPKYDFRTNLISDLAGGLTVGILHIPQGMAYSLLANVPPVVGLYVSFFPVLVYLLMGSSMHLSVGSSTIASLMIGKIVQHKLVMYVPKLDDDNDIDFDEDGDFDDYDIQESFRLAGKNHSASELDEEDIDGFKIEVAAAACLMVGLMQIAMSILQLGALSVYLSDTLISGFTTGAAIHSLTSQIKYLFGVKAKSYSGPLCIIYTYMDVIESLDDANIPTCIISAVSIFSLLFVNECINAKYKDKLRVPVPIELIVIVAGTLVSYFCDLNDEYDVTIVNNIPTGIPPPKLPAVSLMKGMFLDSIMVAIVVFSLSISVSKLLAKRHKYEVNPTQELLAYGTSNVFGAFFSCFPSCASISRSLVQEAAGGKTQLASLASCGLLLVVLLVIAPFFANLPNCVLAAIIVVALKGMFKQFADFKRALKVSKLDATIWAVTFLAVVLLEVEIGLAVGLAFSLLTILLRTKRPRTSVMGNVPYTDIYLDVKKFKRAKEIEGIKIVHFGGALYFANKDHFKNEVYRKTFNPQTIAASQKKALRQERLNKQAEAAQEQLKTHDLSPRPPIITVYPLNNNAYEAHKPSSNLASLNLAFPDSPPRKPKDLNPGKQQRSHSVAVMTSTRKNSIINALLGSRLVPFTNGNNSTSNLQVPPSGKDMKMAAMAQLFREAGGVAVTGVHTIVIDCSAISFIDAAGLSAMLQLFQSYDEIKVKLYLADLQDNVMEKMEKSEFYEIAKSNIFPSIHDAVMYALFGDSGTSAPPSRSQSAQSTPKTSVIYNTAVINIGQESAPRVVTESTPNIKEEHKTVITITPASDDNITKVTREGDNLGIRNRLYPTLEDSPPPEYSAPQPAPPPTAPHEQNSCKCKHAYVNMSFVERL